jgi:hypothetical protein
MGEQNLGPALGHRLKPPGGELRARVEHQQVVRGKRPPDVIHPDGDETLRIRKILQRRAAAAHDDVFAGVPVLESRQSGGQSRRRIARNSPRHHRPAARMTLSLNCTKGSEIVSGSCCMTWTIRNNSHAFMSESSTIQPYAKLFDPEKH